VKQKPSPSIWLPVALMLAFALSRWPGALPNNFSAAYALAFCCGVFLPGRLAWWLPLSTLIATNVLLTHFYYQMTIWSWSLLYLSISYGALVFLGRRFQPAAAWWKLVGGGLLGAVVFYLISNTGAWLTESTQPYPKTFSGWIQALTVGTPGWPPTWTFFRNTLLSGGLFTALFVGAMRLGESLTSAAPEEEASAEPSQPGSSSSSSSEESAAQARP
jgi:hypothetical protein